MKKSITALIIALALMLPAASANIIMPSLYMVYGAIAVLLFIPIVLVESIAAYALLRIVRKRVGFWRLALAFTIANIISSIIGIVFSSGITGNPSGIAKLIKFIIPMYTISSGIETPFIYIFTRKKIEEPLVSAIVVSFFVNVLSYTAIALLLIT